MIFREKKKIVPHLIHDSVVTRPTPARVEQILSSAGGLGPSLKEENTAV